MPATELTVPVILSWNPDCGTRLPLVLSVEMSLAIMLPSVLFATGAPCTAQPAGALTSSYVTRLLMGDLPVVASLPSGGTKSSSACVPAVKRKAIERNMMVELLGLVIVSTMLPVWPFVILVPDEPARLYVRETPGGGGIGSTKLDFWALIYVKTGSGGALCGMNNLRKVNLYSCLDGCCHRMEGRYTHSQKNKTIPMIAIMNPTIGIAMHSTPSTIAPSSTTPDMTCKHVEISDMMS